MRLRHISAILAGVAMSGLLSGCEGEKDLIIIDGDLPIKTSTLYMVGDATPNGWSIDNPTPLTQSADDNLVFSWQGELFKGEIKLCLVPGSWDVGFIRPTKGNEDISSSDLTDIPFQMHAGDPDEKWQVKEGGNYLLTFNLRDWTMSTRYVGAADVPAVDPLAADQLYMVGSATPCGWNIDAPFALTKLSDYLWQYEGELEEGEFKCCTETGSWDVPFVRPLGSSCNVSANGLEFNQMTYTPSPDNKWVVTDAGKYRLTFDLEHFTLTSEFLGAVQIGGEIDPDALDLANIFLVGEATPNGWDIGNATKMTRSETDRYIFTWEGFLDYGEFKAAAERDTSWSCPFLRPTVNGTEVSSAGLSQEFIYTAGDPDNKWRVTEAGNYRITFNLHNRTITVDWLGAR